MDDNEMYDIYQMINNILLQMDAAEIPENAELFEKIRWAFQEMEYKIVRMSNSISIMESSFQTFSDAYKLAVEEMKFKYKQPQDS